MSYLEQKKKINKNKLRADNKTLLPYEELFLTTELKSIDELKSKSVEFLYSDLVEQDIHYDFKPSLGNGQYLSANKEATECIDLSLRARNLIPKKLPDWLEHSQKCFDHLLVKYISDGLKEKVEKLKGRDYETDIYAHLENKEDKEHKIIGSRFNSIYQYRSKFKHIHYTDDNGFRRIKTIRNKDLVKAKYVVLDFYKESLNIFLAIYKEQFSENLENAS